MYTLTQLAEDVNTLLAYNWSDEERDYDDQDELGQRGHIFTVMQRLANWSRYED